MRAPRAPLCCPSAGAGAAAGKGWVGLGWVGPGLLPREEGKERTGGGSPQKLKATPAPGAVSDLLYFFSLGWGEELGGMQDSSR